MYEFRVGETPTIRIQDDKKPYSNDITNISLDYIATSSLRYVSFSCSFVRTKVVVLLYTFIFVATLATSTCSSFSSSRQVLKFGSTVQDYVMFRPDFGAFTHQFSLCSWVKKLKTDGYPQRFHYSTTSSSDEIRITDNGYSVMFSSHVLIKNNQLGITPGTWYHYCMCWSYSSRTADVYYNGVKVGNMTTDSERRLYTGGTLVLGQYQRPYGRIYTAFRNLYVFGGELFKLNIFAKKFTADEVSAMYQAGICSDIEKEHRSYKQLTWESILQQTRSGNVQVVTDLDTTCPLQENLVPVENQLADARRELETVKEHLNRKETEISEMRERAALAEEKLNQTQTELNATKDDLRQSQSELQTSRKESEGKITNVETLLNQTETDLQAVEIELENTKNNLEQTQFEFNTTNADLEQKLKQTQIALNETKADLVVTKSDLTQTQTELNKTKADLEQRLNKTRSDLRETQAESELFKIHISEMEIFSANMSRELKNTRSELGVTKTELNFTKTELNFTKTELKLTKEDVEEIETNLLETRQNLETSLNETKADLDEMLDEQNQNKKKQEKTTQDLDMLKVQLEKTKNRLNQTLAGLKEQISDIPNCEVVAANVSSELAATKLELEKKEEELERLRGGMSGEDCLEETSCSHWDILYNHCYFNNVLTEEKFVSLTRVWEKLGKNLA